MIALGGPNARAQYISRGIVISFQYVNEEPAMVLFPQHGLHAGAFIICMSAAWRYQEHEHLVQQAMEAAQVMGLGTDHQTVFRVASVINNYLEELVKMKPEPDETVVVGEGQLKAGDGSSFLFEITDSKHKH